MDMGSSLKSQLLSYLPHLSQGDLEPLTVLISQTETHVIREPESGLIMMSARDSFDTPFHLGEVLVTKAEVSYRGHTSQTVIMGDNPVGALVVAAVEAIELAGDDHTVERIDYEMIRLGQLADARRQAEEAMVNATRVDFSSMTRENIDFSTLG